MRPSRLSLGLCVAGTVLSCSVLIPFPRDHGFGVRLPFEQLFSSHAGGFSGLDVFVSSLVLWVLVFTEGRRSGVGHLWDPNAANLAVGVSLGLPLLLFLREKAKASSGDPGVRPGQRE